MHWIKVGLPLDQNLSQIPPRGKAYNKSQVQNHCRTREGFLTFSGDLSQQMHLDIVFNSITTVAWGCKFINHSLNPLTLVAKPTACLSHSGILRCLISRDLLCPVLLKMTHKDPKVVATTSYTMLASGRLLAEVYTHGAGQAAWF